MGYLPDNNSRKSCYAPGSLWRPGSSSKPDPSSWSCIRQPKDPYFRHPDAWGGLPWREAVARQREGRMGALGRNAPEERSKSASLEVQQRKLERKLAKSDSTILSHSERRYGMERSSYLSRYNKLSRNQQVGPLDRGTQPPSAPSRCYL